jgi:hypothetical protein
MASSADPQPPQQPLFYREPQQLNSQAHADWRLTPGDAGFTAETAFVPIVASEIAAAARNYPVVFAGDSTQPLALLGLERRNLFLGDDGRWAPDAYVPAYVRRYPFAFVKTLEPAGFALAIDADSPRVVRSGSEGAALFEDGKPSALTREALEFCAAFGRDAELTALFATALREKDLLIDRRADATLPDGRKFGLDGFQIVDAARFAALDDDTILAWQRQGILALVHFHLASLDRFSVLLNRQALHQALGGDVTQSSPADASADTALGADAATPAKATPPKTTKATS